MFYSKGKLHRTGVDFEFEQKFTFFFWIVDFEVWVNFPNHENFHGKPFSEENSPKKKSFSAPRSTTACQTKLLYGFKHAHLFPRKENCIFQPSTIENHTCLCSASKIQHKYQECLDVCVCVYHCVCMSWLLKKKGQQHIYSFKEFLYLWNNLWKTFGEGYSLRQSQRPDQQSQ